MDEKKPLEERVREARTEENRHKKEEGRKDLAATRSRERNLIAFVVALLAAITLTAKLLGWF